MLPVAAAVLLILAAVASPNPVSKMLSVRPMRAVGDASYSLYLWHWPLIVFATICIPGNDLAVFVAVAIAVCVSVLSYRFIETKFRSPEWRSIGLHRNLGIGMPIGAAAICLAVLWLALFWWSPRFDEGTLMSINQGEIKQQVNFATMTVGDVVRCPKPEYRLGIDGDGRTPDCFASKSGDIETVVIGDSHSWMLFPALVAYSQTNVALMPVDSGASLGPDLEVISRKLASDQSVRTVLISAYWAHWGVPSEDLRTSLGLLVGAGKQVFVLNDVPNFPFDASACKYRLAPLKKIECSIDRSKLEDRQRLVQTDLKRVVGAYPGVKLLDSFSVFCGTAVCSMAAEGHLFYYDENHLNKVGAEYLVSRLLQGDHELHSSLKPDVKPKTDPVSK